MYGCLHLCQGFNLSTPISTNTPAQPTINFKFCIEMARSKIWMMHIGTFNQLSPDKKCWKLKITGKEEILNKVENWVMHLCILHFTVSLWENSRTFYVHSEGRPHKSEKHKKSQNKYAQIHSETDNWVIWACTLLLKTLESLWNKL